MRTEFVAAAMTAEGSRPDADRVMQVLEERVWPSPGAPSRRRVGLQPRLAHCSQTGPVTCVELPGNGNGDALHFVAVVEPLSRSSHKIASFLIALRGALGVRCTLLLAAAPPAETEAVLPLDAFHSLALQLDPRRAAPAAATFDVRSAQQTLTLTPAAPAGCCRAAGCGPATL